MVPTVRTEAALKKVPVLAGVVPAAVFLGEHVLFARAVTHPDAALGVLASGYVARPALFSIVGLVGMGLPLVLSVALTARRATRGGRATSSVGDAASRVQRAAATVAWIAAALHLVTTRSAATADIVPAFAARVEAPLSLALLALGVMAAAYVCGTSLWALAPVPDGPGRPTPRPALYRSGLALYGMLAFIGVSVSLAAHGSARPRPGPAGPAAAASSTPLPRTEFSSDEAGHGAVGCLCPPGGMLAHCPVCFPPLPAGSAPASPPVAQVLRRSEPAPGDAGGAAGL